MSFTLKNTLRPVVRSLRSNYAEQLVPRSIGASFDQARNIVRIYYIISVYVSASIMRSAEGYVRSVTEWDFLWPLQWVNPDNADFTLGCIGVACFVLSLLAVMFVEHRIIRVLFSFSFFLASTIDNSQAGGINHNYHAWFWISFILIFLPTKHHGSRIRSYQMSYLTTVFSAQAVLALFYTMAGCWKVYYGLLAALSGMEGNFSLKGLSHQLADRMLLTDTSPLLAHFFIEHYVLAWLGFLAVIYVQFTAIVAAFRPRLHMLWGIAIILFHLGTWLLMEIIFIENVLLLLILFVMSPFAERKPELLKVVGDLPLFGRFLRRLLRGNVFVIPRRLRKRTG